jgi:hypothetical protein
MNNKEGFRCYAAYRYYLLTGGSDLHVLLEALYYPLSIYEGLVAPSANRVPGYFLSQLLRSNHAPFFQSARLSYLQLSSLSSLASR